MNEVQFEAAYRSGIFIGPYTYQQYWLDNFIFESEVNES